MSVGAGKLNNSEGRLIFQRGLCTCVCGGGGRGGGSIPHPLLMYSVSDASAN